MQGWGETFCLVLSRVVQQLQPCPPSPMHPCHTWPCSSLPLSQGRKEPLRANVVPPEAFPAVTASEVEYFLQNILALPPAIGTGHSRVAMSCCLLPEKRSHCQSVTSGETASRATVVSTSKLAPAPNHCLGQEPSLLSPLVLPHRRDLGYLQ